MPTLDFQRGPTSKPTANRRVKDMDEISKQIAMVARPMVKAALEAEATDAGSVAWREEAERALGALLRDEQILRSAGAPGPQVLQALRQGLEKPVPPDENEVEEHAAEVGRVMASAWLQFLALALETKDPLDLGENLLPVRGDVRQDLWDALRNSLNALPVGVDDAPRIMQRFAEQFVASVPAVDLPMGLALDVLRDRKPAYVARRR